MLDRPGSIFKWWLHNEVYYLRTRGFIDKFQFNKGDINIVAGGEVFRVPAGTLKGSQEISFSVESQEGLEKAGTYKGIANFIAQVVSN